VSVELREGGSASIEIVPGPEKPQGEGTPAAESTGSGQSATTADDGSSGFGKKEVGFVIGGVGVVGVGVGITAGILALGKKSTANSQCDDARQICSQEGHDAASSGRTLAAVSTVGWIVGALGVGAGVYLVLTSSGDKGPATALATHAIPGGAALSVTHRF
jgi:hypothetical protein